MSDVAGMGPIPTGPAGAAGIGPIPTEPAGAAGIGRFPTRSSRVAGLVFAAATVAGVAMSALVASGHANPVFDWRSFWLLAVWCAIWIVAVVAALQLPRRTSLLLVVAAAALLRLAAMAGSPTTSDDLYRYAWDGRVQVAGIDPYADPPGSASLARFHESWLWPDPAGCAALNRSDGCTRLNRPGARTIYPPLAEAWFATVYRLGGIGARHKSWQMAGLVTDLVTVGLLIVAMRRWGVDQRWVALYALCPLAAFEIVNNAHVDGLAIALIVAAAAVAVGRRPGEAKATLAAVAVGRRPGDAEATPPHEAIGRRPVDAPWRDIAIGLLLGGATMVKLYPALLLVAVAGLPRAHPWRSTVRATATAAVAVALGYLPHVVAVGVRVIGYLPGYLKEERYGAGGRFLLAGLLGLHGSVATGAAGLALMVTVAGVLWRRPPFPRGAAVLLAALFLITTPVQPWYALSLVAVGGLNGWPLWAMVALAGEPYYFAVILAYRHSVGLGRAAYGIALGTIVAGWLASRSIGQTRAGPPPHDPELDSPSLLGE